MAVFSFPVSDVEIEIFKYLESVLFCFHVSIYRMQIPIQLSIANRSVKSIWYHGVGYHDTEVPVLK